MEILYSDNGLFYFFIFKAVSTIKSNYMLNMLEEIFISIGGEEKWISLGLNFVPEKLQNLAKINNILAFQPWKFSLAFIEENCRNFDNSSKNWNITEFIHACLILVFFHKIATIVESLNIEIDTVDGLIDNCEDKRGFSEDEKICNLKLILKFLLR